MRVESRADAQRQRSPVLPVSEGEAIYDRYAQVSEPVGQNLKEVKSWPRGVGLTVD